MSTETTNKKIKIDNGTTFGRTYTDKAVDELLKNVGGSSVGVIKLNESQLTTFSNNNTVTFTDEQIEILKNENISNVLLDLTDQKMLFNKYVLIAENQLLYCILITYTPNNIDKSQFYTISYDLTEPCTFISSSIPIEKYIKTFDINDVFLNVVKTTNYGSSTSSVNYKIGRINNKPLLVTEDKLLPDFTFTEDKTISLFGKHSILVPKDSADTAINLYIHSITIGKPNDTYINGFTFLITSSSNLVVDSIQDLNTILGTTPRMIPVSGCYNPGTPVLITRLNWKGSFANSTLITTGGEEEDILATFTSIGDIVTTL